MITSMISTVLQLLGWLLRAWVIMILWGWFIVPATGLAAISFWMAFGLWALADLIIHSDTGSLEISRVRAYLNEKSDEDHFRDMLSARFVETVWTLSALGLGYIAHSLM